VLCVYRQNLSRSQADYFSLAGLIRLEQEGRVDQLKLSLLDVFNQLLVPKDFILLKSAQLILNFSLGLYDLPSVLTLRIPVFFF
jgi:hypothetical protein